MFYVPARFAPVLFGFILSGLMSLIVSGVASWRNTGWIRKNPFFEAELLPVLRAEVARLAG